MDDGAGTPMSEKGRVCFVLFFLFCCLCFYKLKFVKLFFISVSVVRLLRERGRKRFLLCCVLIFTLRGLVLQSCRHLTR